MRLCLCVCAVYIRQCACSPRLPPLLLAAGCSIRARQRAANVVPHCSCTCWLPFSNWVYKSTWSQLSFSVAYSFGYFVYQTFIIALCDVSLYDDGGWGLGIAASIDGGTGGGDSTEMVFGWFGRPSVGCAAAGLRLLFGRLYTSINTWCWCCCCCWLSLPYLFEYGVWCIILLCMNVCIHNISSFCFFFFYSFHLSLLYCSMFCCCCCCAAIKPFFMKL